MDQLVQDIIEMWRSGRTPEIIHQQLNADRKPDQQIALAFIQGTIAAVRQDSAAWAMNALKQWHGVGSIHSHWLTMVEHRLLELETMFATVNGDQPVAKQPAAPVEQAPVSDTPPAEPVAVASEPTPDADPSTPDDGTTKKGKK